MTGLDQPRVALVFECFETSVKQFLCKSSLEIAAVRHILCKMVSALTYMHDLGVLHADLKPANILMRPETFAATAWTEWLVASSSKTNSAVFKGCISPKGCIFKVVLADLGNAELANPAERMHQRRDGEVYVCIREYRPPDMWLGNTEFDQALDMWSLGCVAVELKLRTPLFWPETATPCARDYLSLHLHNLGSPSEEAMKFLTNLAGLPCDLDVLLAGSAADLPPRARLLRILRQQYMADFVTRCLQWHPEHRIKAASASEHPFLSTPNLYPTVSVEEGRHGPGSICSGFLDEEVLDYIQNCPSWAEFRYECLANNFEANRCISEDERRLRMKREFVGYVSAENQPPKCKSLNGDANLQPIRAVRAASFTRALRKRARGWLHQLQERVRSEIRRVGLPVKGLPNASPFMDEELSDNAFAYAYVQVCKVGEREDGWHTDGGASLLHAGLTIFGSRQLHVKLENKTGCISLEQRPGSFYIGNMCALEHNVVHGATSPGSWGSKSIGGPPKSQL